MKSLFDHYATFFKEENDIFFMVLAKEILGFENNKMNLEVSKFLEMYLFERNLYERKF